MKRESLKLQPSDWDALVALAKKTGSDYMGKPSWRRFILRVARGELTVVKNKLKKVLTG